MFGGQLIIISGNGFGSTSEGVDVSMDSYPCSIESITSTEISCFSGSTALTHQITNNVYVMALELCIFIYLYAQYTIYVFVILVKIQTMVLVTPGTSLT